MVKREIFSTDELMVQMGEFTSLLSDKQREELKTKLTLQHSTKNSVFYAEGDVPHYLYCLIRGKVKIYKEGVGGRTQIIRVVKPVEYFGYRAFFANQNYVTAAAAFEHSLVVQIPMQLVYEWMQENNQLALHFIRLLSIDLSVSDQRTVSLTQKHIRGRLAEALLFLKATYGLEEDNATLSIYLSREDLANLSNMTTSNAIRTLSAFAAEGLIAIDGRKIKIMDEDALQHVSKLG